MTSNLFFEKPILNSPYVYPAQHWELDGMASRCSRSWRTADARKFITPIPQPRKRKGLSKQEALVFDEGKGLADDAFKKETMLTHWVPGVNRLGTHGRWAFAEFTDVWQMQDDFAAKVQQSFDAMLRQVGAAG